MPAYPSDEWLQAYKDAINQSADFRIAATDWQGDVTFVIEAEPDKGLVLDVWHWLDLARGICRDAKTVSPDEGDRAAFVVRAPYSRWKEVILGRLEPTKAMVQGKLRLKGDLKKIDEQRRAVGVLVALAAHIPSEFVDEGQ
jgi:putative sterol carrier protein